VDPKPITTILAGLPPSPPCCRPADPLSFSLPLLRAPECVAVSFLVARKEAVASFDWLERDVRPLTGRMIDCDVYGRDQLLRILMQRDALRNLMQEFVVTFARTRFCSRDSDSRERSVRHHSENEKASIRFARKICRSTLGA